MKFTLSSVSILLFLFLFQFFFSNTTCKECYWGESGYEGHPLWKRECGDQRCIKVIDERGVELYNCDLTSFCDATGCASNHLGGQTCCCDSQLCNSSSSIRVFPFFLTFFLVTYFLIDD